MRFSLPLFGVALSCLAQGPQMGGPITGLVFDSPSKSLLQILGIPGAARLSPPLLSEVDWASVAPDGSTAVILSQGQARLVSGKVLLQDPAGTRVDGLLDSPLFSCWADDSASLVLYSAANRALQWVRLSGKTAAAEPAVPLTGFDGDVTAIAADRSSNVVAVSVAPAGVYLIGSSGSATPLLLDVDASAIALEPGGKTLWVADRTAGRLLAVTNLGLAPETQQLISDPEKLAVISALGLSSDRKRLYLASRSTQQLYQFDLAGAFLSEGIALDAPASLLQPLGRPSLRLLGPRDKLDDPLYLLDENSGPGLFFVPANERGQAQ
jgi:hypothetical protein